MISAEQLTELAQELSYLHRPQTAMDWGVRLERFKVDLYLAAPALLESAWREAGLTARLAEAERQRDKANERVELLKQNNREVGDKLLAAIDERDVTISTLRAAIAAAVEVLEPISLQLAALRIASCTCLIKSHEIHWHLPTCTYRRAQECLDNVEAALSQLKAATNQEAGR